MLAGFNLVACNDDDKRAPSPEPEITNTHAYGLPVSVGNTAFKTDGQGRLTGIRQVNNPGNLETELEYGSFTVPGQEGEFQVKIQGGRSFWLPMYVRLNPQGFAGYAYMPKSPVVGGAAELPCSFEYEYNADGQLTRYVRNNLRGNAEPLNRVYEIEYVDGDIVSVSYTGNKLVEASYTDSVTSTPIPNATGFMDLNAFRIGSLFEQELFYAGLLGNATRHLPLKTFEQYNWVLDERQRPMEFYEVSKNQM